MMPNRDRHHVAVRPGSRGTASFAQRVLHRLPLWHWLVAAVVIAELCSREPEIEACVFAQRNSEPDAAQLCEQAWQDTRDEGAAVSGAFDALRTKDDDGLRRWARRASMTLEGARILHLWGQRQFELGDLTGAETTLRRVLALRVDRDPLRATNTAWTLLQLVRNSQPVEESIKLARLAWDQASRGHHPLPRAYAASALADLLIDLGELTAADAVIRRMDPRDSRALKAVAEGSLRAAQGRTELAVTLLGRAYDPSPTDHGSGRPLDARVRLAQALLQLKRIAAAWSAVEGAFESKQRVGGGAIDLQSRLTAVEAEVLLAEGRSDAALARVEHGLAMSSRDSARVRLLNVRGDALVQRGDVAGAEQTWREAADIVESWRASIPSSELRSGLLAHHRHALEALLESTAARGDVAGALEVTRRMVGRGLLDRLRQREVAGTERSLEHTGQKARSLPAGSNDPGAPASPPGRKPRADADATIDNVLRRLDAQRERAATIATAPDLIDATHDMVAIMSGARSTWAIRRRHGLWSIDRVGDRASIAGLVEAYRRAIDDTEVAENLGDALFPLATVPSDGAPLVVLVDRELADVPLAGLRVGGRYLVEHAPILELLAPDLLFAAIRERTWDRPVVLGDPSGDLASAAAEADAVARALAVEPSRGNTATRGALASGSAARVLHVAAHSTVGNGEAALVLSDGTLSSLEIVRRRIAPRLAVIATCRSQVDDDPATSLVAAFLAAGAAGVIGVKRALDDVDGAELMREFYRAGGADDPMRALAAAQRAAIARHHLPHSWAAVSFFGVGSWISNQE
jgi:tetratricopeptide (TPR) repeat protein